MSDHSGALPAARPLGRGLTLAMALACGLGVANIYYSQPMLGLIERDLAGSALPAQIPPVTQFGYALGLFLLVPLGDLLERRRVIVVQFLALALMLALAALAPDAPTLLAASLLVGMGAAVAQQIVPFAATLADPATRGRTIGTVMAGLLGGILCSRAVAGLVAAEQGWRAMFWLGVPLALATALAMRLLLPKSTAPAAGLGYRAALASLGRFWLTSPALRRATLIQAGLFASFSTFWSLLALHLQEPSFGCGPEVAGLFGLLGLVGVLAAPLGGRLADRHGPRRTIAVGAALTLLSWALLGWSGGGLAALAAGVLLLDCGVHLALVSNQHVIYALDPAARSRINTVFTTGMFLGGAAGSALAAVAWGQQGWTGAGLLGAGFALLALLRQARPA
ncbi:MAG: hypothetical protein RLZZ501_1057 [Pseudomonadota bacterium]|jgi:predicted MFS family arabinose efflux permease